ncbi:MAG: hypothetical protein C3F12_08065 [Candidatus Methylomirabilota bacterium]|nr:DmsE family decaheme c-type cytochrome [Candidatus Methylomirabilis sp.]NJD67593.1 DmsE family decaheme c-type cytochrome [candidate division NC10 bacterium]PWB46012.1 MAG: hypothetical protein C3F12_08065 [candidate division NC10 bacterium]
MRKRDVVLVLPALFTLVLLFGWSCSRFGSPPPGPDTLQTRTPSATRTDPPRPPWTGPPPSAKYVGSDACLVCHEEPAQRFHKTMMGRVMSVNPRTPQEQRGCESCHGPAGPHVETEGGALQTLMTFKKGAEPVEAQNATCINGCHEKGEHTFWRGSTHEVRGVACVSCHKVMEPSRYNLAKPTAIEVCSQCHQNRRAQLQRSSHMPLREGKISCTDCHNPHGTATQAMLREDSVNENCYSCHAEKRGPFLWEHAPVIESCSNCHEPHGSTNARLLKVRVPRLCQQCHVETRHPTNPYDPRTGSRFVINRGCLNCHQKIHGSNHPSGFAFEN